MTPSFRCPQCGRSESLGIESSLELPADSRSDEIAVQVVVCTSCDFRGAAVYEESRRGSMESEAWEHTGYALSSAAHHELSRLIQSCPDPRNGDCLCGAHVTLGKQDKGGRWMGLSAYGPTGYFPMQRA